MRAENEVGLDFKDVLIRPKRSTLPSRSNVNVSRDLHFRHTQSTTMARRSSSLGLQD